MGDYNVLTLFYRCIIARQQMHPMQQEFQVLTAKIGGLEASWRVVANQFSYLYKVQMKWLKLRLCKRKERKRIVNESDDHTAGWCCWMYRFISDSFVRTGKQPAKGLLYSTQYGRKGRLFNLCYFMLKFKYYNIWSQTIYWNVCGLNSPLWDFQKVITSFAIFLLSECDRSNFSYFIFWLDLDY